MGQEDFFQHAANLAFYLSFKHPNRFVLTIRHGGVYNIGKYAFYHASSLGGSTNLRGFRDTRFMGDAALYQNIEARLRLRRVKTYYTKGSFGLLAFHDTGRVWLADETSKTWHNGYGGGLWFSPFNMMVFTLQYEHSKDEKDGIISLRSGFLF